jgi:hypothetical protein
MPTYKMESLQEELEINPYSNAGVNPLSVPSAAEAWFNLEDVHQIEIDSLPEFFSGRYPSKTP